MILFLKNIVQSPNEQKISDSREKIGMLKTSLCSSLNRTTSLGSLKQKFHQLFYISANVYIIYIIYSEQFDQKLPVLETYQVRNVHSGGLNKSRVDNRNQASEAYKALPQKLLNERHCFTIFVVL